MLLNLNHSLVIKILPKTSSRHLHFFSRTFSLCKVPVEPLWIRILTNPVTYGMGFGAEAGFRISKVESEKGVAERTEPCGIRAALI